MSKKRFELRINGEIHGLETEPDEPLLWVLRDELRLTGTKFGCGEGDCGACSVLVNGEVWRSCQVMAADLSPKEEIVTIEGLGQPGRLSPVQKAFLEHTAFGCGYCTPGMIVNATALLESNPRPSRSEIVASMDDNLCRCAAYPNILAAIESLSEEDQGKKV
jgi:aerobic-type carbon monoxide dehydrogenase small subunit (CoxS/CutS family)